MYKSLFSRTTALRQLTTVNVINRHSHIQAINSTLNLALPVLQTKHAIAGSATSMLVGSSLYASQYASQWPILAALFADPEAIPVNSAYLCMVLCNHAALVYGSVAIMVFYLVLEEVAQRVIWPKNYAVSSRSLAHAHALEVGWTVIPLLGLAIMVLDCTVILYGMEMQAYTTAMATWIQAQQWYWVTEYGEMRLATSKLLELGDLRLACTTAPLFLPVETPCTLSITSTDVLHSFSLPQLGIKADAVPGRNTSVALMGTTQGVYIGYCSELCGIGHYAMPINVVMYDPVIQA